MSWDHKISLAMMYLSEGIDGKEEAAASLKEAAEIAKHNIPALQTIVDIAEKHGLDGNASFADDYKVYKMLLKLKLASLAHKGA